MFSTPDLSHFTRDDYKKIYEPDADSFLLLDALECEHSMIVERQPSIIVEFGSGSGLATTFIGKYFCSSPRLFFALDLNPFACQSTRRTFIQNGLMTKHYLNIVQSDLADPLLERLSSCVDLIIFNPPYVPTETSNVDEVIDRTFAGGKHGIEVIERAIEQANRLLTKNGLFYLLALEENGFDRLKEITERFQLKIDLVMKRRTLIERLFVVRIEKL